VCVCIILLLVLSLEGKKGRVCGCVSQGESACALQVSVREKEGRLAGELLDLNKTNHHEERRRERGETVREGKSWRERE